jgi:phenylacetate-coenzyme A ligase PaaK-like adenylate-forming protein
MFARLALVVRVLSRRRRLERSCEWSRERLQAHQRRCIERLRRFAYERSPFYRRFHAGLMQRPFEELPILTKASLMENFDDVVTGRAIRLADLDAFLRGPVQSALFRNRYVVLATSGSTGQRGVFGQCACGRPFAVIDAIDGRREDVLVFPGLSGTRAPVNVHPHTFHELLEALPAASWQICQNDDGLRISLVGLSQSFETDAVVRQVRMRLEMLGADAGAIDVERAASLVRGRTGKATLIRRAVADGESARVR